MRIGFAAKVLGAPLKEADLRRAPNNAGLAQSLAYLREIFAYLAGNGLHMYRMSSDIARYMTHPDYPRFHNQMEPNRPAIEALGQYAKEHDIRLSFHPGQYILLNSPSEEVTIRSIQDLDWQAQMLDWMGLPGEAVVVLHVGGVYGERQESMERYVRTFERLPPHVQRRLVLENDDVSFAVSDCLWIRARTGQRIVFDNLHHAAVNPTGMPEREALDACLRTWPPDQTPKIHFASPATQFQTLQIREGKKTQTVLKPPSKWTAHADFVDPFAFERFVERGFERAFDVMLEAKAKDLAVIALRSFLEKRAETRR